jgi:hypothetical protein
MIAAGVRARFSGLAGLAGGAVVAGLAVPAVTASPATAEPAGAAVSPASAKPPTRAIVDGPDEDGPVRLSLPSESERAAWRRSGFRLGLGVLYGVLQGDGLPDSSMTGLVIRPGIRLDADWSIYLPLQYAALSSGARFVASVEPTWHITPYLAVGAGLGYGGLISVLTGGEGPPLDLDHLDQSYTYPDSRIPLSECNGVGLAAHGRVELGYVLGPRSRTHLAVEAFRQWTGCEQGIGVVDPYTGTENLRRQFWADTGLTLAWGIEWR